MPKRNSRGSASAYARSVEKSRKKSRDSSTTQTLKRIRRKINKIFPSSPVRGFEHSPLQGQPSRTRSSYVRSISRLEPSLSYTQPNRSASPGRRVSTARSPGRRVSAARSPGNNMIAMDSSIIPAAQSPRQSASRKKETNRSLRKRWFQMAGY